MTLSEEKLKELLRRQIRRGPRRLDCLGEDQFVRAATGELNGEERRAIARHLITCTDCTEEYQIARSLKPWSEEVQESLNQSLRGFQDRPLLRSVTMPPQRSPRAGLARFGLPHRAGLAIAACLLMGLALGGWLILTTRENSRQIARLNEQLIERNQELASAQNALAEAQRQADESTRRAGEKQAGDASKEEAARYKQKLGRLLGTVNEFSRPQLDVPIADLDPAEGTRGDQNRATKVIEAPATANFITLILNFTSKKHSRYAVEIHDHRENLVWRGEHSQKGEARSVNLTLSRRLFPDGRYLIKLYGLTGARELIGEYPVQIEHK